MRISPARKALTDALGRHPWTVSYSELVALAGRGVADRAIAAGEVARVLPSRYCAPVHAASFAARAHAALSWVGVPAALSGESGAFWSGADIACPETITLTVPHGTSRRRPPWLRIISTTYTIPSIAVRGLSVARLDFAIGQGYGRTPERRRSTFVYATLRRLGASPDEVAATVRSMPVVPARRALLGLLSDASAGAESGLEGIGGRRVLNTAAFAHLLRQHEVVIEGRVLRFDFFDPATLTAIELDGAAFHGRLDQRERDIARDAVAASAGILTLRFGHREVVGSPERVRARVDATLRERRRQLERG